MYLVMSYFIQTNNIVININSTHSLQLILLIIAIIKKKTIVTRILAKMVVIVWLVQQIMNANVRTDLKESIVKVHT